MILILDTDHLTVIQRQTEPAYSHLRERLQSYPQAEVQTTIVNVEEQMRGWLAITAAARNQAQEVAAYERLFSMLSFFGEIPVLNYDAKAADICSGLRRSHPRLGIMDLKIAAITAAQSGRLLSRNLKDFQQISGLQVEDWTKQSRA